MSKKVRIVIGLYARQLQLTILINCEICCVLTLILFVEEFQISSTFYSHSVILFLSFAFYYGVFELPFLLGLKIECTNMGMGIIR